MAQDIWIQTDSGKNGGQFLIDADTRERPVVAEGNSLNLYLGAFKFDKPLDLSGFERVNILIRESQTESTPALFDLDVLLASLTPLISLSAWNAQTAFNGLWPVPAANMVFDLGDEEFVDLWIVVTGHNDTSGAEVTLGASALRMYQDNGTGSSGGPDLMLKSVYDTNNNGKVDVAELAESVDYSNITSLPSTFPADLAGAVLYDAVQALSSGEKTQARVNIGAVEEADVDASIAAQSVVYDQSQSLSSGEKTQALTNIGAVDAAAVDVQVGAQAVLYDAVQALSGAEKQQARDNIGVEEALAIGSVLYDQAQSLSSGQKTQARDNIGAIETTDLTGAVVFDAAQALSLSEKQQARNNIGASESAIEVSDLIINHLKGVTQILGAVPAALQDFDTAGVTDTLPAAYSFLETSTGILRFYLLKVGDGSEIHNSPSLVLPNDYNDPTNLRFFELATLSTNSSGLLVDGSIPGTGNQELLQLNLTDDVELTIAGGTVAMTQGTHTVDTQSDDATDDLDEITGGKIGDLLYISAANADRTVVVKHGVTNIETPDGKDIPLTDITQTLLLRYKGTKWYVVGFVPGRLHVDGSVAGTGRQELLSLNYTDVTELTIAAGVITRTQGLHRVDTELNAATDDLVTISGGVEGDELIIYPANDAREVVIKHGTGNIVNSGGQDLVLSSTAHLMRLVFTSGEWKTTPNVPLPAAKPALVVPITVESASVSEDTTYFFTPVAITVTSLMTVLRGTTPSVTPDIKHHTDRANAGNSLVTAPAAVTNTTVGANVTSFDDATIPANSYVWIEYAALSGTVEEVFHALTYTED